MESDLKRLQRLISAASDVSRLFQTQAVSGKEYCIVIVLLYGMINFTLFPLVTDVTGVS